MKIYLLAVILACVIGFYLPVKVGPDIKGIECTEESTEDFCNFEFKYINHNQPSIFPL